MMKTNIIKKSMATLALLAVTAVSTLSFSAQVYAMDKKSFADEMNAACAAMCEREALDNGIFSDDDEWYNTYIEAYNHARFRVGQHAEFKNHYIIFYGWTTKSCTITDIACAYEKGKYAPIYKNSYNNNYYLGSAYE